MIKMDDYIHIHTFSKWEKRLKLKHTKELKPIAECKQEWKLLHRQEQKYFYKKRNLTVGFNPQSQAGHIYLNSSSKSVYLRSLQSSTYKYS